MWRIRPGALRHYIHLYTARRRACIIPHVREGGRLKSAIRIFGRRFSMPQRKNAIENFPTSEGENG